jgi:hypothetical protein
MLSVAAAPPLFGIEQGTKQGAATSAVRQRGFVERDLLARCYSFQRLRRCIFNIALGEVDPPLASRSRSNP